MPQTLPKQDRKHPSIIKIHDREITVLANTLLVFNVFKAGDGNAIGYVGINDGNGIYQFFDKVLFKESDMKITKDFELVDNSNSILGYVKINKVDSNKKPKKVISLAEKKRRDFHKSLTADEREVINMFYKIRVIKMERKQGTTALETALLDKVEYMKSKFRQKFNTKAYMKGIAKKYDFKFEKLNSGYAKRMISRRWAKVDFLKNVRKVE
jgi:hypothetical protein